MRKGIRDNKVLLITEANEIVASGHLFETVEIARFLVKKGYQADVLVNNNAEEDLKKKLCGIQCSFYEYEKDVCNGFDQIWEVLTAGHYDVLVTDLREVSNCWIHRIRERFVGSIVCIDEWGHRQLDCDIIINPMIDSYFWDYGNSAAKLYAGHEYLALPEQIKEYHHRDKHIRKEVERVCISMGGVDRGGSTIKVLGALLDDYPSIIWDVIIGASYVDTGKLTDLFQGRDNVSLSQNISDIYERFFSADITFCAGGNTLHELACIGTPAIVIPSVPHECNNGRVYERKGFGVCMGMANQVSINNIKNVFRELMDYGLRSAMKREGKGITDGNGTERTVDIITGC